MTPEKRLYLQKVRALAERIASRAYVDRPKVVYTEDDWIRDKIHVLRSVSVNYGASRTVCFVRVDAELVDGRDEAYTLNELLPVEEARFALVNLLMQRTPYIRPRLPR